MSGPHTPRVNGPITAALVAMTMINK